MELDVHGKQINVGASLRTHVSDRLEDLNEKYFNHATYATVTFSKEGHGRGQTRAVISIQLGKNIMVIGDAIEGDPYASFEAAATKVGKQMRRYKKKLRDHHDRQNSLSESEIIRARDVVLAAIPEQDDEPQGSGTAQDGDAPLVIAEMDTHVETMTVSEAVMRLDLSAQNAFMFRNASHGGMNMVYRREDGNIGWIDAEH